MPATPTVSVCALSMSAAPPPVPRATATTLGRPRRLVEDRHLEAALAQPRRDVRRDLGLAGGARHERRVDRVDRDEVGEQPRSVHRRGQPSLTWLEGRRARRRHERAEHEQLRDAGDEQRQLDLGLRHDPPRLAGLVALLQRGAEQVAVDRDEARQPVAAGARGRSPCTRVRRQSTDQPSRYSGLRMMLGGETGTRSWAGRSMRRRNSGATSLAVSDDGRSASLQLLGLAARLVAAERDRAIEPVLGQLRARRVVDLLEGVVADVRAAALAVRAVGETNRQLVAAERVGRESLRGGRQRARVLIAECPSAAVAGRDREPAARARADGSVAVAHALESRHDLRRGHAIRDESCERRSLDCPPCTPTTCSRRCADQTLVAAAAGHALRRPHAHRPQRSRRLHVHRRGAARDARADAVRAPSSFRCTSPPATRAPTTT